MSKVRIGTLVVSVVLLSAVDPGRTYSQTNPNDATLSNLTLRTTAGTGTGQRFKGLGGLFGAVLTAPLQAAVSGDELSLSPAFQPDVQSYQATLPFNVTSVKLSATTSHSGAAAKAAGATADGTSLETGMSADGINLALPDGQKVRVDILRTFRSLPVGSSTITLEVTSEDGSATRTYSIALLRSAPDLEDTDDRALYFRESLLAGKADSVSEAVESGVEVNRQLEFGRQILPPLFIAVSKGQQDVVRTLIQAGADVDAGVQKGDSKLPTGTKPLIMAVQGGHEGIARLLIDAGADVNSVIPEIGTAALALAVKKGSESLVRLLIDTGADVNYKLPNGMTSLIMAIQEKHVGIALLMIDAGADANTVLSDPTSPLPDISALIMATYIGSESLVRRLIDAGADVSYAIPDRRGFTALNMARKSGHKDIAKLLRKAGAKR